MICVLKLVTNLVKGNRFGEKVRSLTESSRKKLAEALANLHLGGHVRAMVTVGELGRYDEVHEIVLPKSNKEFMNGYATEGEGVLTLRVEERKLCRCSDKTCEENEEPPLMN